MFELGVMFQVVVVMGFLGSILNYWLIGKQRLNRLVFLFVLSCFIVTEAMVAIQLPIYWLYVALNVFGVYNLWRREDEHSIE